VVQFHLAQASSLIESLLYESGHHFAASRAQRVIGDASECRGFRSKEDYLLALVQADCERAELEPVLEARLEGPFEPLEVDWKQRVREAAQDRG